MNNFLKTGSFTLLTFATAFATNAVLPNQAQAVSFDSGPPPTSTVINFNEPAFNGLILGAIPDVDPPFDFVSDAPVVINSDVTIQDTVGGRLPDTFVGDPVLLTDRPQGSTGRYLAVFARNATFTFSQALASFGLLWGSIDDVNVIDFIGSGGTKTFTGTQIAGLAGFDIGLTPTNQRTRYVNFSLGDIGAGVTRVVLRNTDAARVFEADDVSYRPIPTPALLPGLIGFGIAALRKRKAIAAESET